MELKKQKIIIIKREKENKEQKGQAQQKLQQKQQKPSLDQFLKDKKIVIQTRGALITGIFRSIVNEFLVLENAKL
jgi:TPP-dependent 2-oxoacid decarboxylase